jgi:hypothetical protein
VTEDVFTSVAAYGEYGEYGGVKFVEVDMEKERGCSGLLHPPLEQLIRIAKEKVVEGI